MRYFFVHGPSFEFRKDDSHAWIPTSLHTLRLERCYYLKPDDLFAFSETDVLTGNNGSEGLEMMNCGFCVVAYLWWEGWRTLWAINLRLYLNSAYGGWFLSMYHFLADVWDQLDPSDLPSDVLQTTKYEPLSSIKSHCFALSWSDLPSNEIRFVAQMCLMRNWSVCIGFEHRQHAVVLLAFADSLAYVAQSDFSDLPRVLDAFGLICIMPDCLSSGSSRHQDYNRLSRSRERMTTTDGGLISAMVNVDQTVWMMDSDELLL